MSKKLKHKIIEIISGSIAEEIELNSGDVLLTINNKEIIDVFDYRWLINNEEIVLEIQKTSGDIWEIEVEKDDDEDLGLVFENELMSNYKSCQNNCTFCFVSQMPEGMRETLYFKDDDYRLSFLQGNYITLTNLKDADVDRIIKYRLEPLNISIQTMNKTLRNKMLKNKCAGDSLDIMNRLFEAGIKMNAQVVLCKNHNDGEELEYTINELEKYLPVLKSLTVVPVGLSKHRDGLMEFEPFTRADARVVTDLIKEVQDRTFAKHGVYYIQASDEWYALAAKDVPEASRYEGFEELENGVGMLRLLQDEVMEALEEMKFKDSYENREVTIVTGEMAYPYIKKIATDIMSAFKNIKINVYKVTNDYFGESVTVAGLLTGVDIVKQLSGKKLGDKVIIPISMMRSGQKVFLDDMTISKLEKSLSTKVCISEVDGKDLLTRILSDEEVMTRDNEKISYVDVYNIGQKEDKDDE